MRSYIHAYMYFTSICDLLLFLIAEWSQFLVTIFNIFLKSFLISDVVLLPIIQDSYEALYVKKKLISLKQWSRKIGCFFVWKKIEPIFFLIILDFGWRYTVEVHT